MVTVLVTGANGFIGSHLVRELVKRGYKVNGLIRRTSELASLAGVPISLFMGDVRDPETLAAPMKNVDYVYHLAAELMVTSREAFEETNTQGTIHMLEAAEKYAAGSLKRFLLVSSQAAAGPGDDPSPYDEQREARPVSWYGTSKLRAEEATLAYAGRLPVTVVRPSAVYGEREKDISQSYPAVAHRLQPVLGLKPKYTVMVYVGDLVRGIVEAAEAETTLNQIYFLNHSEVLTTKTVVETIAKAMEKPQGLRLPVPMLLLRFAAPLAEFFYHFTRERPSITRDKVRELSQRFWVTDASKAKRDFGWEAERNLLQGMQVTTKYFLDEEKKLRQMPLEGGLSLWLKYLVVAVVLGSLVEIISALGQFYSFTPPWLVFFIVLGAFGLALGTLAMWLRTQSELLQFLVGTILAGAIEALNATGIVPFLGWHFKPGWPFGITNDWGRSLVLGFAGGVGILLINTLIRGLYKRRLRLG
jgi:nucleoside-diphosphate-sugar epimerase